VLEEYGDLWALPADARCITTNGYVKRDGRAVMGRGCAKEARERYPGLDVRFGHRLTVGGNHVHWTMTPDGPLVTFPVKQHWQHRAELPLILQSCQELRRLLDAQGWTRILLPRPGCGNGGLDWGRLVGPAVSQILDDRVVIVTWEAEHG
jgi:hypothetical protein